MIGTITQVIPKIGGTVVMIDTKAPPSECEKLKDVDIKEHKARRSLNANSYYWQLVGKLAQTERLSTSYIHNLLLRQYGQPEYVSDRLVYVVIPDDDMSTRKAEESDTYHLKPTSQVKIGKDNIAYRTYIMLRGSHSYDTKEMSCLINGAVEMAKESGIETLPPQEIERLINAINNAKG